MWFIELLSAILPFYRASQDAGMGVLDQAGMRDYLEAWAASKGVV